MPRYAVKVTWLPKIGRYKAVCKALGLVEYGHSPRDVCERMDASIKRETCKEAT